MLEIVRPPVVPHLYFWALQASMVDGHRVVGGAHLGLQWHAGHPGSTAVNWGGYAASGGELGGEPSLLPSATGNSNTRDFHWAPGVRYRLRIANAGDGLWLGEVTDLASGERTVVRRLRGGGSALSTPMVWSEVFARCEDPSVVVRWSQLAPEPAAMRVTYQSQHDGGCANTNVELDGDAVLQTTSTVRTIPHDSVLRRPRPGGRGQ
ncbi:MAG: hypothetical protein QOH68_3833 [Nocardioidaceae bacterium]|nr:hypothetical protein [Nocardioidaceae bacterium]